MKFYCFFIFLLRKVFSQSLDVTLVNECAVVRDGMTSFLKCVTDEVDLGYEPFKRVLDTGTGRRLPADTMLRSIQPESWPGKQLNMFAQGGIKRNGILSCQAKDTNTHILTTVTTIKIGSSGGVWPKTLTSTWSVDDVNKDIKFETFNVNNEFQWKLNGNPLHGVTELAKTLNRVEMSDGGFYEVQMKKKGNNFDGEQAIFRLIVRGCPHNTWGSPDCENDCSCTNGGQCDHVTGHCVCPPGFKGESCEIGCGGNRFGAKCQFHCKSGNDKEGCKGRHFCLPDPYGCSCPSGFQGVSCNDGCSRGRYGADCAQECHCKRPDFCDQYTGSCTMGCGSGWTGPSCQQKCEFGKWGENCGNDCHCLHDAPCDVMTGSCPRNQCAHPFTGSNCQTDSVDECYSSPCKFGGTCVDEVSSFRCECLPGVGGIYCEIDYDDCESGPCLHDGVCTDAGPMKYTCQCHGGYTGDSCEINIDDCVDNECENDSNCLDQIDGYKCLCRNGFGGKFCETKCAIGQYKDEDTENCESCPKNFYQDSPMKSFCLPCPDDMITADTGTTKKSDCEKPPPAISDAQPLQTGHMLAIVGSCCFLAALTFGAWYYVTNKNKTRLHHLDHIRTAW